MWVKEPFSGPSDWITSIIGQNNLTSSRCYPHFPSPKSADSPMDPGYFLHRHLSSSLISSAFRLYLWQHRSFHPWQHSEFLLRYPLRWKRSLRRVLMYHFCICMFTRIKAEDFVKKLKSDSEDLRRIWDCVPLTSAPVMQ